MQQAEAGFNPLWKAIRAFRIGEQFQPLQVALP